MKTLFFLFVVGGLVAAMLYLPLDRTRAVAKSVAVQTAHGLRKGWDWVAGVDPPAKRAPPPKKASARRVSREGIVAQPPKEKLSPSDKAALDSLVRH